VVLLLVALVSLAQAGETARTILDRRKALDDTTRKWADRQERLRMTIRDARGGERQRVLMLYERRLPGDDRESVVFFESPAEVKGVGFLSRTHKSGPAEQWMYLPEIQRIRQISSRSRSESFVGSDLSYQDLDVIQELGSWSEADAASSLRGEEVVNGTPTWVVELRPTRDDVGYRRIVVWLGRDDLVPRRLEFYGDGEAPVKRIVQNDISPVGTIPVPRRIEVETPGKGTRTLIESSEVKFDPGLEADLFTQRALERGQR
jgi:outer membrane lipoprotein-sorting protein